MINILEEIDNQTPLTEEEGYELTKQYVNYFWRINKFYSLKTEYEEEDVVSILIVKFYQHHLFDKYDSRITSKKYHIMNAVRTSMIDLLRKHRECLSLESESEDGFALEDIVESEIDVAKQAIGQKRRDDIIEQLPDTSKSNVVGYSPLFGKVVNLSYRMLALHLEAGYKVKDLADIYKNPKTNKPVSEGTISSYIREMREYILDNIVIA